MSARKHLTLLFAFAALVCPLVVAAASHGRLSGTVLDPNGAVIVGASVTVTTADGDKRLTTTTDDRGRYRIDRLPPGVYLVTFEAEGFSEARREGVTVAEGRAAKLDIKLKVAPARGLVPVMVGDE